MASKKIETDLSKESLIEMYKQMCEFRRFEERVGLAYTKENSQVFVTYILAKKHWLWECNQFFVQADYMFQVTVHIHKPSVKVYLQML